MRILWSLILGMASIIFMLQSFNQINWLPTENIFSYLGLPYDLFGLFYMGCFLAPILFVKAVVVKIINHTKLIHINEESLLANGAMSLFVGMFPWVISVGITIILIIFGVFPNPAPYPPILNLYLASFLALNVIVLNFKKRIIQFHQSMNNA